VRTLTDLESQAGRLLPIRGEPLTTIAAVVVTAAKLTSFTAKHLLLSNAKQTQTSNGNYYKSEMMGEAKATVSSIAKNKMDMEVHGCKTT